MDTVTPQLTMERTDFSVITSDISALEYFDDEVRQFKQKAALYFKQVQKSCGEVWFIKTNASISDCVAQTQ